MTPEQRDRPGVVFVSGASSGIGAALAHVFARHGHPVVLHGRSQPRLDLVADQIAATGAPRPLTLALDLSQVGSGREVARRLALEQVKPAFIVNSAGAGLFGHASKLGVEEQIALIDLNCRSLTEITLALLPGAIEQHGGVLNVGSVGGFFPGPGMAVYFATKAYVQSFSQGLRAEFGHGQLRVSALCPGPVASRFQAQARMIAPKMPRLLRHDLTRIAEAGYHGLLRNRAVIVPGFFNRLMVLAAGLIFHRAITPFMQRFHFGGQARPKLTALAKPVEFEQRR